MQWWTRLMSIPTEELWRSMLSWQFLIAVCAVSFVTGVGCCLWWLRPRRRPRRVADRQSRRRGSKARRLRQGAPSAQAGGAQAPPAAAGQTRQQARRWRMENTSKQNAEMTYNSLGIELECAWSAAPDVIAPAEDIRRPRHRVERVAEEPCTCTSSQGAPSAQSGGAQAPPEAADHTQAQARQGMEKMERMKKRRDNLLKLLIELEHTAKLCTCASCKAGKRAAGKIADVASQGAREVRSRSAASMFRESSDLASMSIAATLQCDEGDEARDSSTVASSSASGPYRHSSLQVSSSAAGSATFGAARREGETTSLLPRGGERLRTAPARSGASSYSTTPTKTQRMRISSGVLFDAHIVQARIEQYAPPKERPEQQPAAASGLWTHTMIKRPSSFGDLRMQNAIGLLQRQVPLPAEESPSAETKQSRHQTPTAITRHFSSAGHRDRCSVSVEIPAEPRPQAATGPRSTAWAGRWHSTGDLRPRHQAFHLAARGDIEDPVPQTPLPPQRQQTRLRVRQSVSL